MSASPASVPALEVFEVSKTFPGQRALDRVSLTVAAGEVQALLGENGSGKSTLIKVLAGYHLPDPGSRIEVGGEALAEGSPAAGAQAGLRFVHQHLAVIGELNAVENIALESGYARGAFIDWDAQAAYTRELLARLQVDMDIWRPLAQCKPVERSAVAIARAVRSDGEAVRMVVLDEPTASLPAPEVAQLFSLIAELKRSGIAVLYVTHRLDEVFEIADRVTVLRDGRKQATEPIADLTHERLVELIVGRSLAELRDAPVRTRAAAAPGVEGRLNHRGRGSVVPRRAGEAGEGADASEAPALRVRGLAGELLQHLDLDVARGEIVGVVGTLGSGREEVARALIGAGPTVAGRVEVGGTAIGTLSPLSAAREGLVLATGNTQPGSAVAAFDVRENLTLASLGRYSRFGRIRRRAERAVAQRWVEALDVRPADLKRPYQLLSGGNQQKVIMGRWLNAEPAVLVLEEPTAGVDVGARQAIYELVAARAADGLAVVVCSSDMEDIVSVCDRVVVLRDGHALCELAGTDVNEHELLLRTTGGTPHDLQARS
jgi:ribose transport system ATP-binding protein